MTDAMPKTNINPLIPAAMLVSFVLALATFALYHAYGGRLLISIAAFLASIFLTLSVIFGDMLAKEWSRVGYPPHIVRLKASMERVQEWCMLPVIFIRALMLGCVLAISQYGTDYNKDD